MDSIKINKTKNSPEVVLNKEKSIFSFYGRSLPEDPLTFYSPILKWIDAYIQNPNETTKLSFNLVYFNTSSSKFFFEIMKRFESIKQKNCKVSIDWICNEDDEDMIESGEIYASQVDIPFNIIVN